MRSSLTFASLAMGTTASVIVPHILPRGEPSSVSFTLKAHGEASGVIGQLSDGQNRIGGNLPIGEYTLRYGSKVGEIIDKHGRGCILTPPTTQYQCDEGARPTPGFDISCDKQLLYNGSPEFFACPVDDHGVWNLYTKPVWNQKKCIAITLSCHGDFEPKPDCKAPLPPPPPHKQDCDKHPDECKPAHPPPPPCKEDCSKGHCDCKPAPPPPAPMPFPPPKPKECKDKHGNKCKVSTSGACGGSTGLTCLGFGAGECCSSYGYCGASPIHCDAGCQLGFGKCKNFTTTIASPPPPPKEEGHPPCKEECSEDHCNCKPAPPPPAPKPCGGKHDDECKPAPALPRPCGDKKNKCKPIHHLGCPHDLEGDFEFPHLIVPVDKAQPDKAYGNKFNGIISDRVCTVYNFDIHPRLAGMHCSLVWLFPEQKDLETSAYTFHTSWNISAAMEFWELHEPADHDTTWNSVGEKDIVSAGPIIPGLSYNAGTGECKAGERMSFMVCGKGFSLEYFQDFNPSPIGLYIRAC